MKIFFRRRGSFKTAIVGMMGTIDLYFDCSYEFNAYSVMEMAFCAIKNENEAFAVETGPMIVGMMGTIYRI